MTGPWAPLLYRRPSKLHRSIAATRRQNWSQTPVLLAAGSQKGHSAFSTSTGDPPLLDMQSTMACFGDSLHYTASSMLDGCQAWTPQSDGREPQLKDDTGRREPSSTDRCGQRYCRPGICPWTSPPHCSMLTFLFSGVSTSCQLLALRW